MAPCACSMTRFKYLIYKDPRKKMHFKASQRRRTVLFLNYYSSLETHAAIPHHLLRFIRLSICPNTSSKYAREGNEHLQPWHDSEFLFGGLGRLISSGGFNHPHSQAFRCNLSRSQCATGWLP